MRRYGKLLVTGGSGYIGSVVLICPLRNWRDKLDYPAVPLQNMLLYFRRLGPCDALDKISVAIGKS